MGFRPREDNWQQACRGYDFAGLGLRSTTEHADAAYVALCASRAKLCRELDGHFQLPTDGGAVNDRLRAAVDSLSMKLPEAARVIDLTRPLRQRELSRRFEIP